jgi:hypothetical protein
VAAVPVNMLPVQANVAVAVVVPIISERVLAVLKDFKPAMGK